MGDMADEAMDHVYEAWAMESERMSAQFPAAYIDRIEIDASRNRLRLTLKTEHGETHSFVLRGETSHGLTGTCAECWHEGNAHDSQRDFCHQCFEEHGSPYLAGHPFVDEDDD